MTRWSSADPPLSQWPKTTHSVENYLQQLHAAFQDMLRYEAKLLEEGWIYHPETQHWTHPDKPNTEIWP